MYPSYRRLQQDFAKWLRNFVDWQGISLALRETTALDGRRWFVRQLLIGAAMGWMGPFGTFLAFSFPERLIFWIATTVLIGLCARLCIRAIGRLPGACKQPVALRIAAGALLSGVPGTFLVLPMLALLGAGRSATPDMLAETYGTVCGLVLLLGLSMALLMKRQEVLATGEAVFIPVDRPLQQAIFLRRLSPRLGTELLHLAAEDHYVRAATPLGEELVFCRLSDAITELPDDLGQRVHRSHWVARAAIQGSAKKGGKVELTLSNGTVVPVSETYLPALRNAGWFRKN